MEEDAHATKKLVRIYSFHAEERLPPPSDAHALGCVLSKQEPSLDDITAPWRHFFEREDPQKLERNPLTTVLSVEASKLRTQWLDFQEKAPEDERINVNTSEPTVNGVIEMVAHVGKIWQTKRQKGKTGKAIDRFHRFCGTLNAHSSMLDVIPKGNQYMSLFTGTITSIIKASVNHEYIAEELALALCTISEHTNECEKEVKLFKIEAMEHAVLDLYAHIFLFLRDTMDWYTKKRRKRTLDSFSETFFDKFENEIQNIKTKSENIARKTLQNVAAEQRVTRLTIEETRRDVRLGLEGVRQEYAESRYQREQEMLELREANQNMTNLVGKLQELLTFSAMSHQSQTNTLSLTRDVSSAGGLILYSQQPAINMQMTRDELLLNSANLEDFFHRDRVRLACDLFSPVMVDPEALSRLIEWAQSAHSPMLCITGADQDDEMHSPITMLAAKFIDLAASSNVPVISYFCELRRGQPLRDENTKEVQGLIELVYGIARQMIEVVLPKYDCVHDFSKAWFERLEGSAASWEDAMALVTNIQALLPGRLFCIIDGYQWLDDKSTAQYLAQFVGVLRGERLKVLFTTTGQSRCLYACLPRSEVLTLDEYGSRSSGILWKFEEAGLELE